MAGERRSYKINGADARIAMEEIRSRFQEGPERDYTMVENPFNGNITVNTENPELKSLLGTYNAEDLGPTQVTVIEADTEPAVYEVASESISADELVKELSNDDVPGATKFREGIHYSLENAEGRLHIIPKNNREGEEFLQFLSSQDKVPVQLVSATPEEKKKARA
ncbi:hypothetical protein GF412_00835 [Candidatus Micrarchaeota archaeon]|nr:hypothetical protein [Candidatus Micrarchaeota archaeon]MBD3417519.1 hypothetical protein [Candidatus Micrarchaeota archaeon]